MCGLAGLFAYHSEAPPIEGEELHRIREAMSARGPDSAGTWISPDQRIGLAHRRLAIIDLSEAGAQPMHSDDGKLAIVFNGEIYNYPLLKQGLEARGHRFRSTSDTEVILALYREKGPDLVHDLRGMFAFALWDSDRQGVLLARDPFGIKPLYVADNGHILRFASQVKALLAGGGVDTTPDPAGHAGFYLWGCVPEPHTLYRNIQSFPAGSTQWFTTAGPQPLKAYFDLSEEFRNAEAGGMEIAPSELHVRLREALQDTVRHHLVSDVPVGLFLSAGLDSSTLTAIAREQGAGDLRTLTLGFREYQGTANDETIHAREVAAHYRTHHETRWVAKADFLAHLDDALEAMDQPSTDGINTYFVSKVAASAGIKVALSGLGGDELFGGYPSFRQVPLLARTLALTRAFPGLGRGVRKSLFPLISNGTSPKYAGLLEYGGSVAGAYLLRRALFMPWELPGLVGEEMAKEGLAILQPKARLEDTIRGLRRPRTQISALELTCYMRNQLLRDADWAGMAHGLEIRTPLVDIGLFRALLPLLAGAHPPSKKDMAAVAQPPLPGNIFHRSKTGFSVPVKEWSQDPTVTGIQKRGLRAWAMRVTGLSHGPRWVTGEIRPRPRRRILVLATDAFGGHGGISEFNRNLLQALCAHPDSAEVVALPRGMPKPLEPLPQRLRWVTSGLGGKVSYVSAVIREVWRDPYFDLLVCGHVNLLPLVRVLQLWIRAPLVAIFHGVDVWKPTPSRDANTMVRHLDAFICVSALTAKRFLGWSKAAPGKGHLLPNTIHLERYGMGPKPRHLLDRYGLRNRRVLMTLGRMASAERYKGFDEVMEALPNLIHVLPDLAYLAVGDGTDRPRLEAKARSLGISDRVVFTGLIPEGEKSDHYHLADAYAMPSHGEGFGIVFLEAMACGVPVVASCLDGGREAVLGGRLGLLVNPDDPMDVVQAIRNALATPRGIPEGLDFFAYPRFQERCHAIVDAMWGKS